MLSGEHVRKTACVGIAGVDVVRVKVVSETVVLLVVAENRDGRLVVG